MAALDFQIGFRGPAGGLTPEDRARVDAAIAAATALDATAAQLLTARDEVLAGVRQITGLTAVSGDVTRYDPATGVLTVARGEIGPAGARGPAGPKGDKGDTGPTGLTGATGPAGPQGLQGPKGDTGATGAQGLKGDTGQQGPQGAKGDTGADGKSWTVTVVTTQATGDPLTLSTPARVSSRRDDGWPPLSSR